MLSKAKHLSRFLTGLCLVISFISYSQTETLKYARAIVDTLASPGMHGRGYVLKGDSLAADYIQKEFLKIGLKLLSKEFFQRFTINVNTFPSTLKLSCRGKEFVPGNDFIVKGISGSGNGTFKTVSLKSKALDTEKERKKFKKADFLNKIVIVDKTGFDKIKDGKELWEVFEYNLFKAKAVIFLEENKLTAGYSQKQEESPMIVMLKSAASDISDSLTINIQNTYLTNYQTKNILGYIPGTQYPDSFVVFSAHYDHMGRMGKDVYFPGANDNASGCAMLLSLAKYYSRHPPKYSIAFMAFGAEEVGLIGSKYYVEHPLFPLSKIKFLVNMDIMGTGDEGIKVVNATEHVKEFDRLTAINKEKNYLPGIQPRGKASISDHYYFSEAGVKTFFIYTLGGITAYHDIYDRPETLPLTKFEEAYKLLLEFTEHLQE